MNLRKEQVIYTILLIIGVIMLIGSIVLAKTIDFDLIGVLSGFGGAWIGISIIKLYQIKKKPKKIEEKMIGNNDERNIAIRGYAGYFGFKITLAAISIMLLIFIVLDYTVPLVVGSVLLFIHFFDFLLLTIYYDKKI
jgi:hypothetical protein